MAKELTPQVIGSILGGIAGLMANEVVTVTSTPPSGPGASIKYPRKVIASIKIGDTIKQFDILIKNWRAHEEFTNDLQTKPFFGVMTGASVIYFPRDTVALVEDRNLTEEEIATEKLCGNSDLFEDPNIISKLKNPHVGHVASGVMTIAGMPFPNNTSIGNSSITGQTVIADPAKFGDKDWNYGGNDPSLTEYRRGGL
jgi:hypothetical protein